MEQTSPPPPVSPDGRFFWDGTRWVPMPVSSTSAPPAGKPKPSVRTQILRPLLIVAALVAVLMVWGVVSEHQSQQRSHAAYCQQFGGNDPAC